MDAQDSLKVAIAVVLFAGLVGCKPNASSMSRSTIDRTGGPVTESTTMSTPSSAAKVPSVSSAPAGPALVCFGDSLTAGYGLEFNESYPANLQKDLDDAGYHYHVVNAGISGETTKDGLARVDLVIAMHPAIVVVEFGGNDGLRGVPIQETRSNLDQILQKLQGSGTQIALAGITLPPQYGPEYIQSFNQTYQVLAKKYRTPLIPFVLQDAYGTAGDIQRDGIHPTAEGAKVVAKNVLGLIKPLLRK